ncbi:hypothetical protein [Hyphomonas chukchiensis]|uniref:ATP-grasp domain-containing protein n=1 Tax=Hyphomonas chukchiensis TaxID=1280947 RepID=A0A062UQH2_9PROT|nr:hypothetical protein [Hyphomonas chukchiensis]KCZ60027.1 hypothetical protein HY30_13430 [Hyphomonas chukchiensis]|tara:strand:- start:2022 stop:3173 length:1152 start_codon:yes stop_codon:yes gene_type:complete
MQLPDSPATRVIPLRAKSPASRFKIVFVMHGERRGRTVATDQAFMDRLKQSDPELVGQTRIHRTGSGPFDFRDVGLIVFWLGDPLRQKYPKCYAEAVQIEATASLYGIRVLNSPFGLSNTSKADQARIWSETGMPSAYAARAQSADDLPAVASEVGFPCIIRSDDVHCQRDVVIARSEADARRAAATCVFPAAVITFVDIQGAWRATGAETSLFSQYHHKARAFVFGGEVKASHLFFSTDPIVGLSTSVFAREDTPRRNFTRRFGLGARLVSRMIDADLAHFEAPVAHADELVKAVAALGLDFAAVDYSILPDGRPVIWEANPYFYLPSGQQSVFSAERQAVRRVEETFDWMATQIKAEYARALSAGDKSLMEPETALLSVAG